MSHKKDVDLELYRQAHHSLRDPKAAWLLLLPYHRLPVAVVVAFLVVAIRRHGPEFISLEVDVAIGCPKKR